MTDEQIIAAAGEPVAWQSTKNLDFVTTYPSKVKQWESSGYGVRPLYTADAILAAAKPLREEIERLKTVPMKYRRMTFNAQLQDENAKLRKRIAELERREQYLELCVSEGEQQNAELTKQRDELLVAVKHCRSVFNKYVSIHLDKTPADYDKAARNQRHLSICDDAIASVKDI